MTTREKHAAFIAWTCAIQAKLDGEKASLEVLLRQYGAKISMEEHYIEVMRIFNMDELSNFLKKQN